MAMDEVRGSKARRKLGNTFLLTLTPNYQTKFGKMENSLVADSIVGRKYFIFKES
jgi:hypothetical protein